MRGILKKATTDEPGFTMIKRELGSTVRSLNSMATHGAQLVARYRDLAGRRDLEHPDAKRGMAPAKHKEDEREIELMARTMVMVRMAFNLADELEKLQTGGCYGTRTEVL